MYRAGRQHPRRVAVKPICLVISRRSIYEHMFLSKPSHLTASPGRPSDSNGAKPGPPRKALVIIHRVDAVLYHVSRIPAALPFEDFHVFSHF